ncbi:hypothetical protein ABE543_02725 [Stenotrophomonas sp. TWI169]|uniref:hypothetical protein n=1 Tax=Stenotrophomonas sp. TWI169 TaxID=3136773 RepID=UPI003208FE62
MDFGHGKFLQDTQSIRSNLVLLDGLAISARYNSFTKSSKAFALVWMTASIEDFWKRYLNEVCGRVQASSSRKKRKGFSSSSIFIFEKIGTASEGKAVKRWEKVADILDCIRGNSPLPPFSIPYDGKTIRPDHIDLAWRVFDLPGASFVSPIHRQELNTLADRRNDVAHGTLSPEAVGGTISVGDVIRVVGRMEEIVEHCVVSASVRW